MNSVQISLFVGLVETKKKRLFLLLRDAGLVSRELVLQSTLRTFAEEAGMEQVFLFIALEPRLE